MKMKLSHIVSTIVCWFVTVSAQNAEFSLLQPQGLKFSLPDQSGISLVGLHYNINQPMNGLEHGQVGVDINTKTGNAWVHEKTNVAVKPGDTVYFWYLVVKNGIGSLVKDQTWTPPGSTGPITTSTKGPTATTKTEGPTQPPQTTSRPTSNPSNYPRLIFEDNFDTLNLDVWEHEITAGGGGNWEFQYYTNNRSNSYVRDGKLFIKPTFTVDTLNRGPDGLTQGSLDLWGSLPGDVCTGNGWWGCRRDGSPNNILNPIQSARLRSSRGFNFKYGKVEVRAKMPKGDWIWPAIWMLPLRNAYGKWPASGEIDIVEVRGNANYRNTNGHSKGIDNAGSTLHFGSDFWHNKFYKAHGDKMADQGTYADGFHIFELIWDENHISASIDGTRVMNVEPRQTMWEFGGLDKDNVDNPWVGGNKMAPFDQEFFFILNVAVGGTGGYFPDHYQSNPPKPWSDQSGTAARDFWNARGQWYPTWNPDKNNGEDAAMQVDYIKVWKLKP
ncbi:3-glucan binding protein [Mactra antiquata]